MFDYHVHTEFSVDCQVPMAESCDAAIAAGLTEIAFTDHVDHQRNDPGFGYYRIDDYFRSLDKVRRSHGDRITILAGAEVDFHTETAHAVERFIEANYHRYDFIIGSVHYAAAGEMIYPPLYERLPFDEIVLPYLDEIEQAVRTGWFDSIGHIDIPKRYMPQGKRDYDPARFEEHLRGVFGTLVEHGVAFEINTSGIRQAPKASMPGPAIVRWYVEQGGTRITTGTDSHLARTVGAAIPETLDMLALCGAPGVLSFRGHSGTIVPFDQLRPVHAG